MKKTFICLLSVCLLLFGLLGAMAEENDAIVTVNGDAILQSELDGMISSLSARMEQYGIDATDESVAEAIRVSALQELVDDRLLTQDMTAQGCYDMTEDEESTISTVALVYWEDMLSQYEAYFTAYLGEENTADLGAADLAESYLNSSGYTLAYLENYYRNAMASGKYEQWLLKDAPDITDEEVQAAYTQRVADSKAAYENDVSAFETALSNSQGAWYRPAGYRAILQIMMAAQGDDDTAKLASVSEKTDAIFARLKQGESFASLILEYGEDANFDTESFIETGYQVHQESIIWEDAFVQASFGEDMAQPGDVSQPLVFGDNVHILYYLMDVPEGAVEYTDALASALHDDLRGEQADEKMQERLALLQEDASIVYADSE